MATYNITHFSSGGEIVAAYTEPHREAQAVIDESYGQIIRDGNALAVTLDDGNGVAVISRPYSEGSILDLIPARHMSRLTNGDLSRYFKIEGWPL